MRDNLRDVVRELGDLFEEFEATTELDQLLADSLLYRKSQDYKDLLDFVTRLRNFAPFNAMLLHIQKPGLSYAASARDWRERFGRYPKEGVRPLLILWPFGPVALVYDAMDTEGKPLPEDTETFPVRGDYTKNKLLAHYDRLEKKEIRTEFFDWGDNRAGAISVVERGKGDKAPTVYTLSVNRNHKPAVQLCTLAHELGHLFLGHLGEDKNLGAPKRPRMEHEQRELEAESVAYIVCLRQGVQSKSETYLSGYVKENDEIAHLDYYQVMRAAGQVETILGIAERTAFDRPPKTDTS
jgi:hypothetical protein